MKYFKLILITALYCIGSMAGMAATISGATTICAGSSATLTGTAGGGTWTSSTTTVATIGTSSGVLTGISAGTATITYDDGSGTATQVVTVNPLPAAITGTVTVCVSGVTTLASTTPGGSWSSSNVAVAGVGMVTGIVNGYSAGTAVISYTSAVGCSVTQVVTVNPLPPPITGPSQVCLGAYGTLSDAATGGAWATSNASVAIVNSTGVVTGMSTGTVVIDYTIGTGCSVTKSLTINPLPSPVTGASSVCEGEAIDLNDATVGGTWLSVSPAIASVGSGTGVVTGIAAGTTSISYMLTATGCAAAKVVTVYPVPAAIGGIPSVCTGQTTTLSDGTSGGTWSTSNAAVATVTAGGIVTGISGGTTFISYTLGTGCAATTGVTVNVVPVISGTAVVCNRGTTTFTSSMPGGTWSSSNTAVGSVDNITGAAGGIAAGSATITYYLSGGCQSSVVLTVNPLPNTYNVTGGGAYCSGGAGLLVGMDVSESACTSYQLYRSGIAVGTPIAGTGADINFGFQTSAGTYSVLATNSCTGCSAAMTGLVTVSVNPLPVVHSVTGSGGYCAGGAGISIGLDVGDAGINYQVYNGSTAAGAPVTGPGTAPTLGTYTTAGTYTVLATDIGTGCTSDMNGSANISIIALPPAITGPSAVCIGTSGTLSDAVTGGAWLTSGTSTIINSGSGVITGISAGTVLVTYIAPTGCRVYHAMTVNAVPGPVSGTTGVCLGSTTTLGNAATGGMWSSTNTTIATIGSANGVLSGLVAGTTVISYVLAGSCYATTIASVFPLPNAGTISGPSMACLGSTITLSASVTSGVWSSSNPAIASVTAGGIVYGLTAGPVYINYSVTTGCGTAVATRPVSVVPLPSPIIGLSTVCAGSNITLTNSSPGGSWSSSDSGVATVGSGTGIVTGVAAGVAAVSYVQPSGCLATTSVTVNQLPTPITGGGAICVGGSRVLDDASFGGTWASSNIAVATIGVATGFVNGAGAGSAIMTYKLSTGCLTTTIMTVNPLPDPITGGTRVCIASELALDDATAGGTWSFSGPGSVTIATVGGAAGVVMGVAAGSVAVTYALGTGCITTIVITVDPLPVVTAASDAVICGPLYTLTGGGTADSYSWSPAGGLVCSTCAVTTASVTTATSYVVTGTAATTGCSNSASVYITANRINGHLSFSGVMPAATDSKVWLLQYDPADSSLIATDSVITCSYGGAPYFEFDSHPSGNYMVKARLLSSVAGTSGYVPTYGLSTPYWSLAATAVHGTATDSMDIAMLYGTVSSGSGFISGNVYSGAGKGTATTVPAAGMVVYLKDATNNVLTYAITDAAGMYSFSGIGFGSYTIYPEAFDYHTFASPVVTVSATVPSISSVNFRQFTTSHVIRPFEATEIASMNINNPISIFPNPATQSFFVQWGQQLTGTAALTITDVTGREVFHSTMDMTTAAGKTLISLPELADGAYLVRVRSEAGSFTNHLVIAH